MLSPLSPNCSLDEDLNLEIMTQSAFEVYSHITFGLFTTLLLECLQHSPQNS